jgi:hypothetical protein
VQPVTHRPAYHPPGEEVEDHGQVEPALVRSDVRDIRVPFLVRALGREVLLKQVGSHREAMVAVGGALEPALLPGFEPILPHQPCGPTATDLQPFILQLAGDAGTAVGSA